MDHGPTAPRGISLPTCTSLVVANIVGTGVFTSLGFQLLDLPAGFPIIALWLTGGLFALCGAACYAELASALPRSGGEYHFLSRIFHPSIGFMGGVVSSTVGFAAPIALAAMALGRYGSNVLPAFPPAALAFGAVALVALAHGITLGVGSVFQNAFTLLKVALVVTFVVCGLLLAEWQPVSFLPRPGDGAALLQPGFAVALMYVMYAYSGWNAAVYIMGEVRDAPRTVGRALVIGTLIVTVLYVGLNAVFMLAAPASALAGQLDVGHVAAVGIFGEGGARIMSALISFGLISVLSAMTWAGPRVLQAMGEDFPKLRLFALKSPAGIPRPALITQTALVFLLLATATFESALLYAQFALTLCSALTVLGVIVLRIRQPDLPRRFRVPWYPLPPLVFLAIAIFTLGYVLKSNPRESLAGLATLILATAAWWIFRVKNRPPISD